MACQMLGELIVRPLLRDEEIDRERDVIVEEIRSYLDDASQYVFNVFDQRSSATAAWAARSPATRPRCAA